MLAPTRDRVQAGKSTNQLSYAHAMLSHEGTDGFLTRNKPKRILLVDDDAILSEARAPGAIVPVAPDRSENCRIA